MFEAWGLAGCWGPAEGDPEPEEDAQKLVSDVSEGNGNLLGWVWAQTCNVVYGSRVVCDDDYVVWGGFVGSLPFNHDSLRHGGC